MFKEIKNSKDERRIK